MSKAIIIGATSGIGRCLAKILVENGYRVGITGRRTHLLEEIKAENPDNYFALKFDSTDIVNITLNLTQLTYELGGLDLLIISSGTGDINPDLNFNIEKQTIDTNVSGFTAIADWAFNYFEQQEHGHLVAISSIAGLLGNKMAPSYSATKAYQINYCQSLRQKARKLPFRLQITDIRPGLVDTDMAKGDGLFWVADVNKASKQIFKAIQKKKSIAYVTKRWGILAKIIKTLPDWLTDRM
jgi:short-subunit dehydrogenase